MDIQREWAVRPPSKPMNKLDDLVDDFIERFPRERRDMVVVYCAKAPTIQEAIRRAVASKDESGKHHNHQSKIARECYKPFTNELIKNCKRLAKASDFDELHDMIDSCKVKGIGPLMVYDVAVRIGAFREIEPKSVYLHAGARIGARELGLPHDVHRIPAPLLPAALLRMPADMVEDFLCTYRSYFRSLK